MSVHDEMREAWERSFAEQVDREAFNTAPVEALIRSVAYWLRDRPESDAAPRFLEVGCGAGPNLVWLARKGARVSGVDIAPTAVELARRNLAAHGVEQMVDDLREASADELPYEDESFDGVVEALVFSFIPRRERERAFAEVARVLRPGGLFVAYLLERGHTVFGAHEAEQAQDDPGTLVLEEGGSKVYLTDIGLTHFFDAGEVRSLLPGFRDVDPCLLTYELPASEARKRGYDRYLQSMLVVHAVK